MDEPALIEAAAGAHRRPVRFGWWLAGITAAGLVLRVLYVLLVMRHVRLGFDSVWYDLQAGTIANGSGYVDPSIYYAGGGSVATAVFPPLWPSILALVHLVGFTTERAYELTGALIGGATIVLTGLVGRRVAGPVAGLVAAVLVGCSPALVAGDGSLMSEGVFVAVIALALLLAYRALDHPSVGWWALLGAVLGVATLARSDGLVLGVVLVVATAIGLRGAAVLRRLVLAAVAIACLVVVLVPWTVRSSRALGTVVVVSSNSSNLLEGANCPQTYSGPELGLWDPACLRYSQVRGVPEAVWARKGRQAAIRFAAHHVSRLPLVASARVAVTFGVFRNATAAHHEVVESRSARWQDLAWVVGLVVLALAVVGGVVLARRRAPMAPLVGTVVGVVLLTAASNGNPRLRLPAVPALAVLAAVAIVGGVARVSEGSRAPEPVEAGEGLVHVGGDGSDRPQ